MGNLYNVEWIHKELTNSISEPLDTETDLTDKKEAKDPASIH
jgi:hypothetical protein